MVGVAARVNVTGVITRFRVIWRSTVSPCNSWRIVRVSEWVPGASQIASLVGIILNVAGVPTATLFVIHSTLKGLFAPKVKSKWASCKGSLAEVFVRVKLWYAGV